MVMRKFVHELLQRLYSMYLTQEEADEIIRVVRERIRE